MEAPAHGTRRSELTIRGEDFDGGVPTRIMPALLRLQRAIDRACARSLGKDGGRLAREERKRVELIVRFEPGSTTFSSELAPVLNNALAVGEELTVRYAVSNR